MSAANWRLLNACADTIVGLSRTMSRSHGQKSYGRLDRLRTLAVYPLGAAGTANKVSDLIEK